ncbi:hypothetical protein Q9233_016920 [Columba guinea]|nr:hypothetical protein Q9233_016920 [Columba guinea]
MVQIEILPDGISSKILTTGEMELFTPMDCEVGRRSINLDVKVHIITPENGVWLCPLTTSLTLHPLLISDSRVVVFQVSSMTTCALSRGDSIGTVLFVSQTQRHVEVQSEKAQAMAFQSVWSNPGAQKLVRGQSSSTCPLVTRGQGHQPRRRSPGRHVVSAPIAAESNDLLIAKRLIDIGSGKRSPGMRLELVTRLWKSSPSSTIQGSAKWCNEATKIAWMVFSLTCHGAGALVSLWTPLLNMCVFAVYVVQEQFCGSAIKRKIQSDYQPMLAAQTQNMRRLLQEVAQLRVQLISARKAASEAASQVSVEMSDWALQSAGSQEGFCVMCRMEARVNEVLHSSASAIEPWAVARVLTHKPFQACTQMNSAAVSCTGFVRLVDGKSRCSGRVEIRDGDQWKTVCGSHFGPKAAEVVCRELQCGVALPVSGGDPTRGRPTVIICIILGALLCLLLALLAGQALRARAGRRGSRTAQELFPEAVYEEIGHNPEWEKQARFGHSGFSSEQSLTQLQPYPGHREEEDGLASASGSMGYDDAEEISLAHL